MRKANLSFPHYVQKRGDKYYFRYTLSRDLQELLGQAELRRALCTSYRAEAAARARRLAVRIESFLTRVRAIDTSKPSAGELRGHLSLLNEFAADNIPVTPTPEPSSIALLAGGILGIALSRRRRSH